MAGPLSGVRVIEWAVFQQGPVATAMLGDLGAEVIKIEQLGVGDPGRGLRRVFGADTALAGGKNYYFETFNRNKKGMALDLKKEKAKEIVYRLVKRSDIFVQNYRKGTAERLGMDYETLSKHNPRLIYAQASGYGLEGPDSARPCLDAVGQARSGFMRSLMVNDDCPPVQVGGIADQSGAVMLSYGILAALVARDRLGTGQKVDCSFLSSMMWLQSLSVHQHLFYHMPRRALQREQAANPLHNFYRCADGKWIFLALLQADRGWPDFVQAIQRPELEVDARFATSDRRYENRIELTAILDKVFAARSSEEWLSILKRYQDFIFESVNAIDELEDDPQVIANRYIVDFEHPGLGTLKMVNLPVTLSKTPAGIHAPAPECGQHTEEVLLELGYTWDEIEQLKIGEVI